MNWLDSLKNGVTGALHFKRSTSVSVANTKGPANGTNIYEEEAVSALVNWITRVPDVDEVLKQAGINRSKLRVIFFDDEIWQCFDTRLDAVLGVARRIELNDGTEGDPDPRLIQILESHWTEMITGAFQARPFGYSVIEVVFYERSDGLKGIKYAGEKPFEWFEPKSDGRLIYYPDNGSGGSEGIECDQQYKFFLTRVRPTYIQPYGEALLSRLYWAWFFRSSGWKFWAKFLERFGSPLLVGQSADPTKMVAALLKAHAQSAIGIDRLDTVLAVGPQGGNNGQSFEKFEQAILRRIQKVILGQTLTSGTDGAIGSRALGQVHNEVRNDKRDSDITLITATCQRIVNALCVLNAMKPHKVIFGDERGLETERAMRDTNLVKTGVRFNASYFVDNYGLRPEDFTTADAVPLSPPPAGPQLAA